VHSAPAPFTSHGNLRNFAEPILPAYGGSSSSNFTVQDHIATTTGDALMQMIPYGTTAPMD